MNYQGVVESKEPWLAIQHLWYFDGMRSSAKTTGHHSAITLALRRFTCHALGRQMPKDFVSHSGSLDFRED